MYSNLHRISETEVCRLFM